MDIPYGFDCYSFNPNELKYFDSNVVQAKSVGVIPAAANQSSLANQQAYLDPISGHQMAGFVRFTRKNEDYTSEQLQALAQAGRLNASELNKQTFCGIKIQIGIGVVANFLNKGLQYKRPNRGRSELINGTWGGIVSGLTVDRDAANSYDIAFGNFLAYDEEFPHIKFGPFFAIESKLVLLTGGSRSVEASSFGTNIGREIWLTILSFMLILSLLASFRVHWQHTKHLAFERAIKQLLAKNNGAHQLAALASGEQARQVLSEQSVSHMLHNFFFIYFTMLLNKPSLEFDDFIWPKHNHLQQAHHHHRHHHHHPNQHLQHLESKEVYRILDLDESLRKHYNEMFDSHRNRHRRKPLPSSIRILSYLWSAACLVMASIYSGEMLAVILLHADQNIDTISQLIESQPPIEPVIRQDDFTYNLMLKSLDSNMLILHNMTKIVPRPEVYTRRFIESVSQRKQALLGDDELIETIYDIYHKHFPLYRSKITYLQYPISIMYRRDLNATLEAKLRRGMVQVLEMGLIERWYQAQKDTYIQFYDSSERGEEDGGKKSKTKKKGKNEEDSNVSPSSSEEKYKPLSMHHFESFFKLMLRCILFAFLVLFLEIVHAKLSDKGAIQPN